MEEELQRFREISAQLRAGHPRGARPYPAEQKEFALRYAAARQQEGARVEAAARELGVSGLTLQSWRRRSKGTMLQRVQIVSGSGNVRSSQPRLPGPSDGSDWTVHGPAGLRVEGLSMPALVELCRELTGC
jgi:hypothetical protein